MEHHVPRAARLTPRSSSCCSRRVPPPAARVLPAGPQPGTRRGHVPAAPLPTAPWCSPGRCWPRFVGVQTYIVLKEAQPRRCCLAPSEEWRSFPAPPGLGVLGFPPHQRETAPLSFWSCTELW